MRQVATIGPEHMELRDVPVPQPGPGEAMIRVERVGICGSDLHFFLGDHPYTSYPLIQGHEFAGMIAELGEGYQGSLREGDRVAVEPLVACGHCYACRRGRYNCCVDLEVIGAHRPGALQDYFVAPISSLHAVGDLEPDLAALVEPVSIGYQAVARADVQPGEQVVVYGAGPIGQAVLLSAIRRGGRVLVTDLVPSRLALASTFGAEVTVHSGTEDLAAAITEWTDGDGPAVAVDATGVPAVVESAFDHVAASGRVVLVGISTNAVSVPLNEYVRKELTVLGSRNNAGVFGDAVELVRENRDRIGRLVSHRFELPDVSSAIRFALDNPDQAEKVMIEVNP